MMTSDGAERPWFFRAFLGLLAAPTKWCGQMVEISRYCGIRNKKKRITPLMKGSDWVADSPKNIRPAEVDGPSMNAKGRGVEATYS
jgi:hypothetical protein